MIKKLLKSLLNKFGFDIIRINNSSRKKINTKDPDFDTIKNIPGFLVIEAFQLFKVIANHQLKQGINLPNLEIGVYCGKSLIAIAKAFANRPVIGIDPFYNSFDLSPAYKEEAIILKDLSQNKNGETRLNELKQIINRLGLKDLIEIRTITQEEFFSTINNKLFGLIHIDGEHSYKSIMDFFYNINKLMKSDCILVIDDFLNGDFPEISEAVHSHKYYNDSLLVPVCYGFNKALFMYKPSKKAYDSLILDIYKFAKLNNYTIRKSSKDESVIINKKYLTDF